MISFDNFSSLIKVSITKHNPKRFDDVGKICREIFFLLLFSIAMTLLSLFSERIVKNHEKEMKRM
jgi:hypothetical protein